MLELFSFLLATKQDESREVLNLDYDLMRKQSFFKLPLCLSIDRHHRQR
jgi:hypothetical protein